MSMRMCEGDIAGVELLRLEKKDFENHEGYLSFDCALLKLYLILGKQVKLVIWTRCLHGIQPTRRIACVSYKAGANHVWRS